MSAPVRMGGERSAAVRLSPKARPRTSAKRRGIQKPTHDLPRCSGGRALSQAGEGGAPAPPAQQPSKNSFGEGHPCPSSRVVAHESHWGEGQSEEKKCTQQPPTPTNLPPPSPAVDPTIASRYRRAPSCPPTIDSSHSPPNGQRHHRNAKRCQSAILRWLQLTTVPSSGAARSAVQCGRRCSVVGGAAPTADPWGRSDGHKNGRDRRRRPYLSDVLTTPPRGRAGDTPTCTAAPPASWALAGTAWSAENHFGSATGAHLRSSPRRILGYQGRCSGREGWMRRDGSGHAPSTSRTTSIL